MSPSRTEKLVVQLRRHADETRVPKWDRPKVQEEDRGDGSVSPHPLFSLSPAPALPWLSSLFTQSVLHSDFSPNWSSLWPPALLFDSSCTDVQTHRSWRRKLLRVPSVAFSCHRMNCCAFPARTTCPTASPRYKQTINDLFTHKIFLSEQDSGFLTFIFNQMISLSGSSHAERRLVCVSSLWISGSVLTVQSVSEFLTPPWKIAWECPLLKGQLHCFYSSNCIYKCWKALLSMWYMYYVGAMEFKTKLTYQTWPLKSVLNHKSTLICFCVQVVGDGESVSHVLWDSECPTGEEDLWLFSVPAGWWTGSMKIINVYKCHGSPMTDFHFQAVKQNIINQTEKVYLWNVVFKLILFVCVL